MEAVDAPTLSPTDVRHTDQVIAQMNDLFGSFKAEWLNERLFQFFNVPSYYTELQGARPTVLVGGRGTGKTTVLRGLSYEGQYALSGESAEQFVKLPSIGLYYKVNTSRVAALQGPELADWRAVFGHYFNLIICGELVAFLQWFSRVSGKYVELEDESYELLALSLGMRECTSVADLAGEIARAQIRFEAFVNNVGDPDQRPALSMLGRPIELLSDAVRNIPGFEHKRVDVIIDEYENLADDQQQVVNTLIKHSSTGVSYKIGVRELGWRVRTTLTENEQLISPSDYDLIDVSVTLKGESFRAFAEQVCRGRLEKLRTGVGVQWRLDSLFPGLTEDEEAERLGASALTRPFAAELDHDLRPLFDSLPASRQVVIVKQAALESWTPDEALRDFSANPTAWRRRFTNYKHAYLYSIKRGKVGIRKYYAGWDTLVRLAGGNIRYLLELVEESLVENIRSNGVVGQPVPPELQTRCAARVAQKNLAELEGLAINGTKITKLVLSLGRVFQIMAQHPESHTPEVNQFRLSDPTDDADEDQEVGRLLNGAVMHLALIRSPGNKLANTQIREYDYILHPLFAALFNYSHRRKRKMVVRPGDLLGLVSDPPRYIREVLASAGREPDDDIPEQLSLFRDFYGDNDDRPS